MNRERLINILELACKTGEVLTIKYLGGSVPGSVREIQPRKIDLKKIEAFCLKSNSSKTFVIDKIEILESIDLQNEKFKTTDSFSNLFQLNEYYLESGFKQKDWLEVIDNNSFYIFKKFKNGNPMKTPFISIDFEEFSNDYTFNQYFDKKETEKRKTRPWVLRIKDKTTRTYSSLNTCAQQFLLEIQNI